MEIGYPCCWRELSTNAFFVEVFKRDISLAFYCNSDCVPTASDQSTMDIVDVAR